jgi:hypothetical protein
MDSSFRVRGRSDRFDEDDPAWLDQYAELVGTMTYHGVPVARESITGAVHKGAIETIVVTLASGDSLRACADAWRSWLGRDSSRWIELTHAAGGSREAVVLRADDRFDHLVGEFAARLPAE